MVLVVCRFEIFLKLIKDHIRVIFVSGSNPIEVRMYFIGFVPQFKGQSEFMAKLHDVIRECGIDHAIKIEIVKFLFLTHNQNSCVCKELLKNMKDGDTLNTILGYAKHIKGTQHSEHLSKVYLHTIKIPKSNVKVEAIMQKCNGSNKRQTSKHWSQSMGKPNNKGSCCNCCTNHPPKKCLAYGKLATLVIKKAILSHFVELGREAGVKENGSQGNPA